MKNAVQQTDRAPQTERPFLPYGRQSVDEADVQAVSEVLRSDFLTCGPKVAEFEERMAARVGAKYAVAMNSATSALHVAMLVAGITAGDRVLTSPNTFLASANCVAYAGATPDFADIDPVTYNLDPEALLRAWQPDTKAVVAVDYGGQPCDMPRIAAIARERGALVVEDASHGIGGRFLHQGRVYAIGGHSWADATVFSFHPVKTMTTGEGGLLVTDNAAWAERARRLRSHGVVREAASFQGLCDRGSAAEPEMLEAGPWYYEMQELGYNYRITDLQCALGLAQLARLDRWIARRREIVARYNCAFADLSWLRTPAACPQDNRALISWHLYSVLIDFRSIGKSRTQVMADLRSQRIGSQVLYIPVYLQPWYRQRFGYNPGKCPEAEKFYRMALSLPLFPAMTDDDADRVIHAVRNLFPSANSWTREV